MEQIYKFLLGKYPYRWYFGLPANLYA